MHVPKTSGEFRECVAKAAAFVKGKLTRTPEVAMVLGSGLNTFADHVENALAIPYSEIPFMPQTNVAGHDGKLVIGDVSGRHVLCFSGRVHAYEGYPLIVLTFATRLAAELGIKVLIATNAAGGAGPGMTNGCVMLITDFVNFTKNNPLAAIESDPALNPGYTPTDAAACFNPKLANLAREVAKGSDIKFFEGTYMWCTGPSYETPLEVRSGRDLGCSAFGMSTVPEVLTAQASNMQVLAFSVVTNMAAGLGDSELTHAEVTQEAKLLAPRFQKMMFEILAKLDINDLGIASTRKLGEYKGEDRSVPLIVPSPIPPTASEIKTAATALKGLFSNTIPTTAVVWPQAGKLNPSAAVVSNAVSLSSLPAIPSQELSAAVSAGAVHIWGRNAEWSRSGGYIAQVLAAAGVTRVVSIVQGHVPASTGGSLTPPPSPAAVLALQDALTFSNRRPHLRCHAPAPSPADDAAVRSHVSCQSGGVYTSFQGPSFPSPAEQAMVKKCGSTIVGTSDISAHLAARAVGVNVQCMAVQGEVNDALLSQLYGELAKIPSWPAVTVSAGQVAHFDDDTSGRESPAKKAKTEAGNGARPMPMQLPIVQGEPGQVKEAAAFVQGQAPSGVDLSSATIVVLQNAGAVDELASRCQPVATIPYTTIPHLPATLGTDQARAGAIVVGRLKGDDKNQVVIGVVGTSGLETGDPLSVATLPLRVAHALGGKRVVIAVDVHSCDNSAATADTVVVFDDHTNLVGYNPLTGDNHADWGARFPDMSRVYSPAAVKVAQESLQWKPITIGNIQAPILPSPYLEQAMRCMGGQGLVTSGVLEALAARHLGLEVAGLGHVVSNAGERTALPSRSLVAEALSLVQGWN